VVLLVSIQLLLAYYGVQIISMFQLYFVHLVFYQLYRQQELEAESAEIEAETNNKKPKKDPEIWTEAEKDIFFQGVLTVSISYFFQGVLTVSISYFFQGVLTVSRSYFFQNVLIKKYCVLNEQL